MANVEAPELIAPGMEGVVAVFREGVEEPERSGAALSVWRDGVELVRVRHGVADARTREPWRDSTASVLFSCSKGLSSIVVARLHERGILDLDAPVADVWPEFAAHGKGRISLGDAMAHRAGVSAPAENLTLDDALDVRAWASRIAEQEPLWEPGSGHAYHALTFGTIVQEVVWRATGRELHELFDEEVAAPLDADVTLKAGPGELDRVAHLVTSDTWEQLATAPVDDRMRRAMTLGGALPFTIATETGGFNDPRVQTAGFAGAGAIGTASGLAKTWSAVILPTGGARLLSDDTISAITRVRSEGPWVFPAPAPYQRWGAGVELAAEGAPHLSATTFGHGGAGGQAAFADPASGVALAYLRNRLDVGNAIEPILVALREALA